MASIFKKRILQERLEKFEIPDFENKLAIIQKWLKAHQDGHLQKKNESEAEQAFNQDIFVKVLDFNSFPDDPHTIIPKGKTEVSSQKPDAILGHFTNEGDVKNVAAVCEIKDANTPLDKAQQRTGNLSPIQQAFKYRSQYNNCNFVIATNFFEIRLFKDNQLHFEKWTLETLANENDNYFELRRFYYLLCRKHLVVSRGKSTTLQLLSDIQIEQEKITKSFYKLYKELRQKLIKNIMSNNKQARQKSSFYQLSVEKAQKIIDRTVFVAFCEDIGLLPENILHKVIESDNDTYGSTWDTLKGFFNAVDTGSPKLDNANGYNGELFKPDADLDTLIIDDEVCRELLKIGKYDFSEDLTVNILGHIFEQSISDLEELKAISEDEVEQNKKQSKRKKDGIFYTPEYIVDYIVKNSVGAWLKEKEKAIFKEKKVKADSKDKKYQAAYEEYQAVLQNIKVLDPACGSGAFLVKVFDFLLEENQRVVNVLAGLRGGAITFDDTEKTFKEILQNNIYGVDLNAESVEITKLSLWLKTAQKGKKLASLYDNIKCGNSLIDNPSIAGKSAFKWEEEFKEIMDDGGFDVVIGNPPYLRVQGLREHQPEASRFYDEIYDTATGNYDIYVLFVEKAWGLTKEDGLVGYILPHKWTVANFGVGIREFLASNKAAFKIIDFGHELVFADASTYTCLLFLSKNTKKHLLYSSVKPSELNINEDLGKIPYSGLNEKKWILSSKEKTDLLDKILDLSISSSDLFERIFQGAITGKDDIFIIKGIVKEKYFTFYSKQLERKVEIEKSILKPHLRGSDIKRYQKPKNNEWLIFPYSIINGKAELIGEQELKNKFPKAFDYLKEFEHQLRGREKGKFNDNEWYRYSRNQAISLFEQPKIITPEICNKGSMTLDSEKFYHNSKCHGLVCNTRINVNPMSLLAILNSSVFWFFITMTGNVLRGGYYGVKRSYIEPFQFPKINLDIDNQLNQIVKEIINIKSNTEKKQNNFKKLVLNEYNIDIWPRSIDTFWQLDLTEVLNKLKLTKLPITEKDELLQLWNKYIPQLKELDYETQKLDQEIDNIVFDLYGLTDKERKIVLDSTSTNS